MVISTERGPKFSGLLTDPAELRAQVEIVVHSTWVTDVHTHLFPPGFQSFCLFGIDELLTYHYLVAETFRSTRVSPDRFWQMSKTAQADLVWQTLFVDNLPTSEATRGVISVLDAFGLDTRAPDLKEARAFFNSRSFAEHLDHVFDIARVSSVVMTNDPWDDAESEIWNNNVARHSRFKTSLRLDRLLDSSGQSAGTAELRHLLDAWIQRLHPVYMAVSLPPEFKFPGDDTRDRLLREVVLPTVKEHHLPSFAGCS